MYTYTPFIFGSGKLYKTSKFSNTSRPAVLVDKVSYITKVPLTFFAHTHTRTAIPLTQSDTLPALVYCM
jgi:hypothetical protein